MLIYLEHVMLSLWRSDKILDCTGDFGVLYVVSGVQEFGFPYARGPQDRQPGFGALSPCYIRKFPVQPVSPLLSVLKGANVTVNIFLPTGMRGNHTTRAIKQR